MKTIGIYSYPRSGSNWVRLIIYSLLTGARPFTNQELERDIPGHPDGDPFSGPPFETNAGQFRIFKTHALNVVDAFRGREMNTQFYFYVYRHPLDVFCSYLNYLHVYRDDLQWAFELPLVSFEDHLRCGTIDCFFSTFLVSGTVSAGIDGAGSWWKSVEYWKLLKSRYDDYIVMMRYEDLVSDPIRHLSPTAAFFHRTPAELTAAMESVSNQYSKDGQFFWKMQSGYHKELLPRRLIDRFNVHFGDRLQALGYDS